jgi:hypothetical protein
MLFLVSNPIVQTMPTSTAARSCNVRKIHRGDPIGYYAVALHFKELKGAREVSGRGANGYSKQHLHQRAGLAGNPFDWGPF